MLFRNAKTRLLVGIVVFTTAAAALLPSVTHRVSTDAIVTAELFRLVTPIDGRVEYSLPAIGEEIMADTPIVLVTDPSYDVRELYRIEQEIAAAEGRRAALQAMLADMQRLREELEERARTFSAASVERLREEVQEAEAELARREAIRDRMAEERRRAEGLRGSPAVSQAELITRETRWREAVADVDAARARLRRLSIELTAARDGLTLRDTYNDVPQSRQHAERLRVEAYSVIERLSDTDRRLSVLRLALREEEERMEASRRFSFSTPRSLIVWNRHVQPGQIVRRGEALLDLVSCDDIMVEATFPERAYSGLEPGGRAELIFRGGVRLEGRIESVRGTDARYAETRRAGRLPGEPGLRSSVLIALPAGATERISLPGDRGLSFCGIGRTVEVRVLAEDSLLAVLLQNIITLPYTLWNSLTK